MSLATTCTSCGTVFRVVQDQLKVSQGWVRCGRCDEVFNALEGLFDLERDSTAAPLDQAPAPPSGSERSARPAEHATPRRATPNRVELEPGNERHDPALVEEHGDDLFPQRKGSAGVAADSRFSAESINPGSSHAATDPFHDAVDHQIDSGLPLADSVPGDDEARATAPGFLRHAEQRARWQRPWVRLLLVVAGLALASALALQAAHHFRDPLAARWPATAPLLAQWCSLANCSIGRLRRIDDVAVESSSFTRIAGGDQFRLSVVLRNRGTLALAMPWIELSLTDANGSLLARKALSPRDFRADSGALEPSAEVPLQLLLAAGTPLVTGYTVEVFYP